jgi:hypothetical protein
VRADQNNFARHVLTPSVNFIHLIQLPIIVDKSSSRKSGCSMSVPPYVRGVGSLVPSRVRDWLFVSKETPDVEMPNDETPQRAAA